MAGLMAKMRRFFALDDSDSYSISSNSVDAVPKAAPKPRGNLVNIANVARRPVPVQQIVVLEPSSFGEAREMAEGLKQRKPIIINVRKTDKELARRIVDFLSGISYAIDGHMHKIADQIYIFAPSTVEILSQGGTQPEYQKEQDPLFAGA